jgi:Ca2+-binding EF-hand superfamily protein
MQNLRGAFYKFDDDHNGLVTKKNFRRMLNSFMIIMTDDEFEKLCQKLGVDKSSKIGYLDFLNAFETRETVDGHKLWKSSHK